MESLGKILTDKPTNYPGEWISISKKKSFVDCPAAFRYNYIERLPTKTWAHHTFGKFIHEILENFHKKILSDDIRPENEIMTECFKISAENYKGKIDNEQKKEIWIILRDYLTKRIEERENGTLAKVLAVEEKFYIDVADNDNRVLINGFIDRTQLDPDGVLHVADYKTSKNKKYLKDDFLQLQTYAYVKCLQDPTLEKVRCSYIMLRHNFDLLTKEYTRKDLLTVEKHFLKFAEEIKAEKLWRPKPSPLCKFCSYLDRCEEGRDFINQGVVTKHGAQEWGETETW